MGTIIQLTVGILLGVIAHSSFNRFYGKENNLSTSEMIGNGRERQYEQLFAKQMTKEDIDNNVSVHQKLAEYVNKPHHSWHGEVQFIEVNDFS
jgi:hypothetical protein